jgi:hypothetical protein
MNVLSFFEKNKKTLSKRSFSIHRNGLRIIGKNYLTALKGDYLIFLKHLHFVFSQQKTRLKLTWNVQKETTSNSKKMHFVFLLIKNFHLTFSKIDKIRMEKSKVSWKKCSWQPSPHLSTQIMSCLRTSLNAEIENYLLLRNTR